MRLVTRQGWSGWAELQRAGERFPAAVRPSLSWATIAEEGLKTGALLFEEMDGLRLKFWDRGTLSLVR